MPRVVDLRTGRPVEEPCTTFDNLADLIRAMKKAKGTWELDDDPRARCFGWRETNSGQRVRIDVAYVHRTATLEQKRQLRTAEDRKAFGRKYSREP